VDRSRGPLRYHTPTVHEPTPPCPLFFLIGDRRSPGPHGVDSRVRDPIVSAVLPYRRSTFTRPTRRRLPCSRPHRVRCSSSSEIDVHPAQTASTPVLATPPCPLFLRTRRSPRRTADWVGCSACPPRRFRRHCRPHRVRCSGDVCAVVDSRRHSTMPDDESGRPPARADAVSPLALRSVITPQNGRNPSSWGSDRGCSARHRTHICPEPPRARGQCYAGASATDPTISLAVTDERSARSRAVLASPSEPPKRRKRQQ
jgi:hypothetical protein